MSNNMADDLELIEIRSTPRRTLVFDDETNHGWKIETPNDDNNLIFKAAQLKRRLEFCEKEKDELSRRFNEVQSKLTDEEKCQLTVKTETVEDHKPLICIGGDGDDDVIFIPPDDYSPRKKMRLQSEQTRRSSPRKSPNKKTNQELSVTFSRSAENLSHAREHCQSCRFVQSNVTTATISCNEAICAKCYCYVCDELATKCDSWKTGENPHCNAYAKNVFWEKMQKEKKRKKSAAVESILQCLAPEEQTEEISQAASDAMEFVSTIKEATDLSQDTNSSDSYLHDCGCDCHYDSDRYDDGDGCYRCEYSHIDFGYNRHSSSNRYRVSNLLQSASNKAVEKARSHLSSNKPSMALVVLDTVTTSLFSADLDMDSMPYSGDVSSINSKLIKCWIEVAMCADIPPTLLTKAKKRIAKSVEHNSDGLFASQAKKLNEILKDLKNWNDPQVVKCLAGKCSGNNRMRENIDIYQTRLEYLKNKNRYAEAINYILGSENQRAFTGFQLDALGLHLGNRPERTIKRMCDTLDTRKQLLSLLILAGRAMEAVYVSCFSYNKTLPDNIGDKSSYYPKVSGKHARMNNSIGAECGKVQTTKWEIVSTPLRDMSQVEFKKLLTIVMDENHSGKSTPSKKTSWLQKLQTGISLVLSGTQNNSSLRSQECFEWYINLLCEGNMTVDYLAEGKRLVVQEDATKVVKKAKTRLPQLADVIVETTVPFKVFVVELLIALMAELLSVRHSYTYGYYQSCFPAKCLQYFYDRGLQWACISIFMCPGLQEKIESAEVEFFVNTLLPKMGSHSLPQETYEKWFTKLNAVHKFDVLFKIAETMMKEGARNPGKFGSVIKKNAVLLSGKLSESILLHSHGHPQKKLKKLLDKVRAVFSGEATKLGMGKMENRILELEFTHCPSVTAIKALQKSYSSADEWLKKRATMLEYLQKNAGSYQEACVEIFSEFEKFDDLKKVLTSTANSETSQKVAEKIHQVLVKLHRPEHQSKAQTMANMCQDWLSTSLVDVPFYFFRRLANPITQQTKTCLTKIHAINTTTFKAIMTMAFDKVTKVFLNNTVQASKREDLVGWLRQVKAIFCSVNEVEAWKIQFRVFTCGSLKRKPAIIRHINCSALDQ